MAFRGLESARPYEGEEATPNSCLVQDRRKSLLEGLGMACSNDFTSYDMRNRCAGTWACVKLRLEAMRAAIRHGTLPAVKDRAAAGRANPKHITVKGYGAEGLQGSRAGGNAGAEGLQASRANGIASAADTGSEMDDEGSEGGGAVKRRAVKRRLERWKAEAAPKPAKKGDLLCSAPLLERLVG